MFDVSRVFEGDFKKEKIFAAIEDGHDGESQLLFALLRDDLVFSLRDQAWFGWSGLSWREYHESVVCHYLAKILRSWLSLAKEGANEYELKLIGKANARLSMASGWKALGEACLHCFIKEVVWDSDPNLIACQNTIINLAEIEKPVPPNSALFIRKAMNVAYDPEAECPRWLQFINEIFPDTETAVFIQRYLGSCLYRVQRDQVFLILYGPQGRNGKDILVRVLAEILGDFYCSFPVEDLTSAGQGKRNVLYLLEGMCLASLSEPAANAELSIELVKLLTGGGWITADRKFKDPYQFLLGVMFVLLTNHKPRLKHHDSALAERLLLVLMDQRFLDAPDPLKPNEHLADKNLLAALMSEKQGILNWLIDGWVIYQAAGLCPPPAVLKERNDYISEEDLVGRFIEEKLKSKPDSEEFLKAVYTAYRDWAVAEGLRSDRLMASQRLAKELKERGYVLKRTGTGTIVEAVQLMA